jgi:hypothetical protein
MSGEEPEGFLGRWSRRKRTAALTHPEAEPETPPEIDPKAPEVEPEPEEVPEAAPPTLSEEELAALPRIEDLVQGSDIRPFLRPGVPRALKNAALRRIWMLTPVIRDHQDPAVDYAWDWNTPGGVPGDGVAPSPERTAKMLKSLLSPQEAPSRDEGAGDAAADADEAVETSGAETPAGGETDPPKQVAPKPSVQPVTEGPGDAQASAAEPEPPLRRRHGSALPG